jgi:hypothetical protein
VVDTVKRIFLTFQIALISLLVVMSTTAAGLACHQIRKPFSAEVQSSAQPIDPGYSWFDEKGIMHVRGMVGEGTITGDVNGQLRFTQNMNLDVTTFSGNIQIKAVITADSGAVYEMFAYISVKNMALSGIFMIYGTGSAKGTCILGTVGGVAGGIATLNGIEFTTKL